MTYGHLSLFRNVGNTEKSSPVKKQKFLLMMMSDCMRGGGGVGYPCVSVIFKGGATRR